MIRTTQIFKLDLTQLAVITFILLFTNATAFAGDVTHLQGDKAKQYIGDIEQKFTSPKYTYEILKRRHRDSMNGRNSDAVIFTQITDRILYRKRDDGDHWFVINHPEGREEDPSSDNPLVWNPIRNTLEDDHPNPHVFLDEQGVELAVIFIGSKSRIKASLNSDQRLEVKIEIKQAGRSNRKRIGIK